MENISLKLLAKKYIKAARELRYDEKYIKKIEEAKTENEMMRIMTTARKDKYKD